MEGQGSPSGGVRQQQAVSGDTLYSLGRWLQTSDAGDQSPQNLISLSGNASSSQQQQQQQQAAASSSSLFGTSPSSIAGLGFSSNPPPSFLSNIAASSESPLMPPITPGAQPHQRAENPTPPSSQAAASASQSLPGASSAGQQQQQQQQQQQHSLLTRKPSMEAQQIPSSVATLYQMSHQGPLKNVSVSRAPPGPSGTAHNKSQTASASASLAGNYGGFETALGSQILVSEQPPSPNTSQLVLCEGANCGALLEVKPDA